ncbi:putative viral polymerase [Citrus variegation virus]|uniref:RNA-directed RNA polymerase 2a n=2 Tax=Citrus variegation virus TaxID=37127 RepID=A5JVP5_9BROM|nr:putative viral polymerase [Citrus variegation virus]ABQ45981.1 putative viral polymerase [Citrus variegation virus]
MDAYCLLSDLCDIKIFASTFNVEQCFEISEAVATNYLQVWMFSRILVPVLKFHLSGEVLLDRITDVFREVLGCEDEPNDDGYTPTFIRYDDDDDEPPPEAYLPIEEREEIHAATFLGHEHWASVTSGSDFYDDLETSFDETINDDMQKDVMSNMPADYQIMWNDGAVDAVWSSRFECEEPPKPKFKPQSTDKGCDPVVIQAAIDDIFPFHHEMDDRYFQTLVETQDISLEVSKCWIDASNFRDFVKGQDSYAIPAIQSGATSRRVHTQREALLAVKKRNMNIPELQSTFDLDAEVNTCLKKFLSRVVDLPRLRRLQPMTGIEVEFFNQYLLGKNPPLKEYQGPLPLCSLDKYMHMVKTIVKPVEDNSLKFERPLCATITYHKKGIVMQSSPLFLSAMSRLFYVLKSKIHIPSGKWHQLFTLDAEKFDAAKWFKEVDFSKFDKSQGELHHKVQEKIFECLKLPPGFVEMWFTAHERSHITDREAGIGYSVDFQRRTGDANTYLGNTLVTLICLARVYDLCDPNITFVIASGDDSLIGSVNELPRGSEDLFTTLFNFEAKFPHNQPFICSKFLVSVDLADGGREVIAVPNPAKLLIRMGRRDCQFQALDDLYTSWLDVIYYFRDSRVCEKVASLCAYRQTRRSSMYLLSALLSLPSCFANKKKFKWLCYHLTEQECLKITKQPGSAHVIKKNECSNESVKNKIFPRRNRGCWEFVPKVKTDDNYRYIPVGDLDVNRSPSVSNSDCGSGKRSDTAGSINSKNTRPRNRFRAEGVHQPSGRYSNRLPPNNRRST